MSTPPLPGASQTHRIQCHQDPRSHVTIRLVKEQDVGVGPAAPTAMLSGPVHPKELSWPHWSLPRATAWGSPSLITEVTHDSFPQKGRPLRPASVLHQPPQLTPLPSLQPWIRGRLCSQLPATSALPRTPRRPGPGARLAEKTAPEASMQEGRLARLGCWRPRHGPVPGGRLSHAQGQPTCTGTSHTWTLATPGLQQQEGRRTAGQSWAGVLAQPEDPYGQGPTVWSSCPQEVATAAPAEAEAAPRGPAGLVRARPSSCPPAHQAHQPQPRGPTAWGAGRGMPGASPEPQDCLLGLTGGLETRPGAVRTQHTERAGPRPSTGLFCQAAGQGRQMGGAELQE